MYLRLLFSMRYSLSLTGRSGGERERKAVGFGWSRGTCGGRVVLTRARARRPTQSWDLGVKGW